MVAVEMLKVLVRPAPAPVVASTVSRSTWMSSRPSDSRPLSRSSFTARARNLPKDDCRYACIDYPDGLELVTQDDNRFLALNGIQAQSARTLNLLQELPRLRDLGVDILRISPQANGTAQVIDLFHQAVTGALDAREASIRLERLMPAGPCDGYWHGEAGMDQVLAASG